MSHTSQATSLSFLPSSPHPSPFGASAKCLLFPSIFLISSASTLSLATTAAHLDIAMARTSHLSHPAHFLLCSLCGSFKTHKWLVIPWLCLQLSQHEDPDPPPGPQALHNLLTTASLGILNPHVPSSHRSLHIQCPAWNSLLSSQCPSRLCVGSHTWREAPLTLGHDHLLSKYCSVAPPLHQTLVCAVTIPAQPDFLTAPTTVWNCIIY